MTKLIVASSLSRAFLDLSIQSINREKCIVIDTDDSVRAQLKNVGISSIPVRGLGFKSWAERDTSFRELAMPGNLDMNFPGTDLPVWKVLSIDRLSFWFKPSRFEIETVLALDWENALVPLDLRHSLPWVVGRMKPTMAVQTQPIRTRDWVSLFAAGQVPFSEMIAWNQRDSEFISGFIQKPVAYHELGDWSTGTPVTDDERKALKKAMGYGDVPVCLILFESQTEWEFRTCIQQLLSQFVTILIYPVSANDRRNLLGLGVMSNDRITIIDNPNVEPVADKVILFRYNEELMRGRRVPIAVYDITNRWLSKELAA